jgi:hypothetical protein
LTYSLLWTTEAFEWLIVASLLKKYQKAIPRLEDAKASHEGLTKSLDREWVEKWSKEEEKAMKDRGDALRVFDVVEKKGMMFHFDMLRH